MDGIGHCVEAWIAYFGKQHLVHKAFKLYVNYEGSKVDFHSDNVSSHEPPKVVRQSLSSCV